MTACFDLLNCLNCNPRLINTVCYCDLQVELTQLRKSYRSLVEHKNRILCQRLWYIVLEQFLMKYVWSGTGMVMVSLPILTSKQGTWITISDLLTKLIFYWLYWYPKGIPVHQLYRDLDPWVLSFLFGFIGSCFGFFSFVLWPVSVPEFKCSNEMKRML